jgi:hypothetical protein
MSISFKQYLVEEEKSVFFSFGRMNPPTIGHGKLLDMLAKTAGRNPYRMYLSQSAEPKKNPLSYREKIKTVRKMFPKHARSVLENKKIKTVFDAVQQLYDDGFRKVVMVVGSDRIREFDVLLNKYNGKKGKHGLYNFADIKVLSAGDRDPDAEGVSGMSASKMRDAARGNDFSSFAQGLPKKYSNADSKRLFNNVRKGMNLKEAVDFHKHIQLKPVSATREAFVAGESFKIGDEVIIKEDGQVCTVTRLGSNYIIVESAGKSYRKWLDSVEKVIPIYHKSKELWSQAPRPYDWGTDASDKEARRKTPGQGQDEACWDSHKQVGTKKGKNGKQVPNCVPKSENKNYFKGLKRGTADKRAAHFNRNAKKSDNDASAYKPAPGDATGKTKPSKYTKSFKAMFDEEDSRVDVAKTRIDREKKRDDIKHDRMMDRARTRDTLKKNRVT